MNRNLPVVAKHQAKFDGRMAYINYGFAACVKCVEHADASHNGNVVVTTPVVAINYAKDGSIQSFETMNTIYTKA